MQKSEDPWKVDFSQFYSFSNEKERLNFLLKFAILAPSSHNSQPWIFQVSDTNINVKLDLRRILQVADQYNRQAIISIGCAIRNIEVAAQAYGYVTRKLVSRDFQEGATLIFELNKTSNLLDIRNLNAILARTMNRGKYKDDKLPDEFLRIISKSASEDCVVTVITNKEMIEEIANVTVMSSIESMSNREFRNELSHHVLSSGSQKLIGMPGETLGFSELFTYLAPYVIRLLNVAKLNSSIDKATLVEDSPYIIIISTISDKPEDWISAGSTLQEILIQASAIGVSADIWAAPMETGNYYRKIQEIIGTTYRPQVLFRLGYPVRSISLHSPRLSASTVTID